MQTFYVVDLNRFSSKKVLRQHGKDCRKVDAQIVELTEKKKLMYWNIVICIFNFK